MFTSWIRIRLLPLLAVGSLAASGCSDDPTTPPPISPPPTVVSLSILAGDGQTATVGSTLPVAPTVLARTETGVAAPAVRVSFVVESGGGALAGSAQITVVTDTAGRASVPWVLGESAGANSLRAFLADDPAAEPVFFTATALRKRGVELTSPSNAGEVDTFISPPVATVTNADGSPAAGVVVTFSLAGGQGTLTDAVRQTDALGQARVGSWRLGRTSGAQLITAAAPGFEAAVLSVEALPGSPVALVVAGGADQTATVMTRVPVEPAVKLVDRFGNGVPRTGITWTADDQYGAYVVAPYDGTDLGGVSSSSGWNLGIRPGAYTLTASVTQTPALTVTFEAEAIAGPPAALAVVEGNGQVAPAGTRLPIDPAVQVTDTWGNPLASSGVLVLFTPRGLSGQVTEPEISTGADGIARVGWTIGPLTYADGNLLTAESAGLRGVSFRATGK